MQRQLAGTSPRPLSLISPNVGQLCTGLCSSANARARFPKRGLSRRLECRGRTEEAHGVTGEPFSARTMQRVLQGGRSLPEFLTFHGGQRGVLGFSSVGAPEDGPAVQLWNLLFRFRLRETFLEFQLKEFFEFLQLVDVSLDSWILRRHGS